MLVLLERALDVLVRRLAVGKAPYVPELSNEELIEMLVVKRKCLDSMVPEDMDAGLRSYEDALVEEVQELSSKRTPVQFTEFKESELRFEKEIISKPSAVVHFGKVGSESVVIKSFLNTRAGLHEYRTTLSVAGHSDVVKILGVCKGRDKSFIIFKKYDMDARDLLDFYEIHTLDLMLQMAQSVYHFHSQVGYFHVDVKPENFLVELENDGRYRIVLADFGLSQPVSSTGLEFGFEEEYRYAPPSDEGLSFKWDVYSLGVTFMEILEESKESLPDWILPLCLRMVDKDPISRINLAQVVQILKESAHSAQTQLEAPSLPALEVEEKDDITPTPSFSPRRLGKVLDRFSWAPLKQ